MPKLCVGQVLHDEAGLEGAIHEVHVVHVDEVQRVHEADAIKNLFTHENAAGWRVSYGAHRIKLAIVQLAISIVLISVAEPWLEVASRSPDLLRLIVKVDHRCGHGAVVLHKAIAELGEEFGGEYRVIVQQENGIAAVGEGGADALIVAFSHTQILSIGVDANARVAKGGGNLDGVVFGGVIDDVKDKLPKGLAGHARQKFRQHLRAIVGDRDDADALNATHP